MSVRSWQRLGTAVLLCALATGLAAAPAAIAAIAGETSATLELILDSSGSMAGRDPSGVTKIVAAKHALTGTIDSLPADSSVAVRVYGARFKDKARGCTDTQLVLPLGPLDNSAAKAALTKFQPGGYTPIAFSLQQAAKDLPKTGQRTIVLVSDGEETCNADPCAVAKSLAQQGIDLHVDTVGFGVSSKARQQLTCIAQTTGGHYYDAPDAPSLNDKLSRIAVRAFRPYSPSGTPIRGTAGPAGAPVMRPGQYVDTLKQDQPKHYAIDLADGVTPYIAATVLRVQQPRNLVETDSVTVALSTSDGTECGTHIEIDQPGGAIRPLTGYAAPGAVGNAWAGEFGKDSSCGRAGRYTVSISRSTIQRSDGDDLAMEIVFVAEPPVKDVAGLPVLTSEQAAAVPVAPKPAGAGAAVAGGGSFGDAASVDTGTFHDTIRPGETLYYRVKLDWGQRLSYRAQFDPVLLRTVATAPSETVVSNPVRIDVDPVNNDNQDGYVSDNDDNAVAFDQVPVAFRNRESSSDTTAPVSLAGEYYIRVELDSAMQRLYPSEELNAGQVPLRLAVQVSGDPTGKPDYIDTANAADPGQLNDPKPAGGAATSPARGEAHGRTVSLRTVGYASAGGLAICAAAVLLLLPWLRRRRPAALSTNPSNDG